MNTFIIFILFFIYFLLCHCLNNIFVDCYYKEEYISNWREWIRSNGYWYKLNNFTKIVFIIFMPIHFIFYIIKVILEFLEDFLFNN